MPAIIFVTRVPVEWAIVIFSLAFFGQQSWSTLVMIVPTDLFDRRIVASVAGLVGFGGAMGGLLMNLVAGRLLDLGLRLRHGLQYRRHAARDRVRGDPHRDSAHSAAHRITLTMVPSLTVARPSSTGCTVRARAGSRAPAPRRGAVQHPQFGT